jgi:hypothetical protein
LSGYNYWGTITNCYANGSVIGGVGSSDLGGLCGKNWESTITNCLWDIETGGPDNGLGTPLPTSQMQTQTTFTDAGWDFVGEDMNGTEDIWRLCVDGTGYPGLAWEYSMYGDFVCGDGLDMYDFDYISERYPGDGCGGLLGSDGGTVDLGMFAKMGQYWLTDDCGDCGGADVSGDGSVSLDDMLLCTEQWLCSAPVNWDRADLDCDGQVNEIDIDIWIDFWLASI